MVAGKQLVYAQPAQTPERQSNRPQVTSPMRPQHEAELADMIQCAQEGASGQIPDLTTRSRMHNYVEITKSCLLPLSLQCGYRLRLPCLANRDPCVFKRLYMLPLDGARSP